MLSLRTVAHTWEVLITVQCLGEGNEPQSGRRSGVGGLDGTGLGSCHLEWLTGQAGVDWRESGVSQCDSCFPEMLRYGT